MTPELRVVSASDGLRLALRVWGDHTDATPILCLPGLVRTGGDFAGLAARHGARRLVVAIDYPGRGGSDRASDWRRYGAARLLGDVLDLCAALHLRRVLVVGTSLGGLLAMGVAAARPGLLAGVVLNDVGPEVGGAGLGFVRRFVASDHPQHSLDQAAGFLRRTLPWLSLRTEAEWRAMAELTFQEGKDGVWRARWDPAIARTLDAPVPDLWPLFGALSNVPVLLVRGGTSDILSEATAARMQQSHPALCRVTLEGVGHAPTLSEPLVAGALDAFIERIA